MKLELTRIAAILLVLVLPCACSGSKAPNTEQKVLDVVEAYGRFVEIRRAEPIDFEALIQLYETSLATYVRRAAVRYGIEFHRPIIPALEQGRAGRSIYANAQVAEKSIQRAFILTFTRSLDRLEKPADRVESLSLIQEAAPVIRSTAGRRSGWAGKGSEYTDLFDAAMSKLTRTVEQGRMEAVSEAKAQLDALVTKALVLSVFYELDGLEKARGLDSDRTAEKQVEAKIYHMNLMEVHKEHNDRGADTVAGQLSGGADQIDIDMVRRILGNDFKADISDVDPSLLGLSP